MQEDRPLAEERALWSDLLDLSALPLSELDRVPRSALVESVRRILAENEKQPTTYSQYHANI